MALAQTQAVYVQSQFRKALSLYGNTRQTSFQSLDPSGVTPPQSTPNVFGQAPDGIYTAGDGGAFSPLRVRLLPYGDGDVGAQFSVRLYSWSCIGEGGRSDPTAVWIPVLLAEIACTLCNRAGPSFPPAPSTPAQISPTERFCDSITLTQGSLGPTGYIVSCGAGSNFVAHALVETGGARLIQFDFQATTRVNMNCLWAFV